jgi:hypothetical protein
MQVSRGLFAYAKRSCEDRQADRHETAFYEYPTHPATQPFTPGNSDKRYI